jgi:hypothetical protein
LGCRLASAHATRKDEIMPSPIRMKAFGSVRQHGHGVFRLEQHQHPGFAGRF